MNWQSAFDIDAGLLYAVLGWLMRMIWDSMRDHARAVVAQKEALEKFKDHVTERYVRVDYVTEMKDDIRRLSEAIFTKFDKIEEKMDRVETKIDTRNSRKDGPR